MPVRTRLAGCQRNVVLGICNQRHVAWTKDGIGKSKMIEHATVRFSRLEADLKQRLSPDRKVFFCVHQSVEHKLPEPGELPFAETACAHWKLWTEAISTRTLTRR